MTGRHRRRGGALALCVTLVVTLGAGWATGATAGAQEASLADPNARAVEVAIELTRASVQLGAIDREAADVATRLAAAEAALQAAQQQLTATEAQLESALDRLQGRAVTSYRLGGAPLDPVLDADRLESLAVVKKYANAAAAVDNTDVERLRAEVAKLTTVRDAAAAEQQSLSARAAELTAARATVAAQVQTLEASLAQLGGVPVMGTSVLSADQIAAWFASTGARANLPAGTTIADLAQTYLDEGAAERLRGEVAFAQSIVETGSFRETRGNNYSGIGNCDSCGGKGMMFPTPTDGVRAQIQLLRSYADADSRAANLGPPPPPPLRRQPRGCRDPIRQLLPQGEGAALEPDGRRQLGHGPDLRREGARGVRPDARVRPRQRLMRNAVARLIAIAS